MNNIIMPYENHIIIDSFLTWPDDLKSFLKSKSSTMQNYLHKKNEIDIEAEKNVYFRIYRPVNEFEYEWNEVIDDLKLILIKYRFIGFHCSRLITKEIEIIKQFGLEPLSGDLIKKKLSLLKDLELITDSEFQTHLANNLSDSEYRKNRVFTIHSLWNLQNGYGLYPLWDCWGGEALHFNKNDKDYFFQKFSRIGLATIVITSHSYAELEKREIEERIINNYLYDSDDLMGSDFDNCHFKKIKVLDCVTESDELFQKLTKYSISKTYSHKT